MAKKEIALRPSASFTCIHYFAMACAIVLSLSAFLAWGSVSNESVAGTQGDGVITLILGIAALLFLSRPRLPLCIPLILGIIALVVSIWDYLSIAKIMPAIGGQIGLGLYLTIVSSFLLIVSTFIQWQRR